MEITQSVVVPKRKEKSVVLLLLPGRTTLHPRRLEDVLRTTVPSTARHLHSCTPATSLQPLSHSSLPATNNQPEAKHCSSQPLTMLTQQLEALASLERAAAPPNRLAWSLYPCVCVCVWCVCRVSFVCVCVCVVCVCVCGVCGVCGVRVWCACGVCVVCGVVCVVWRESRDQGCPSRHSLAQLGRGASRCVGR
jgi:hypothetical protein